MKTGHDKDYMKTTTPNIAIIRGDAEYLWEIDLTNEALSYKEFTVLPDDSYNDIRNDQIILAELFHEENISRQLASFTIANDEIDDLHIAKDCDTIRDLLNSLVDVYMNGEANE